MTDHPLWLEGSDELVWSDAPVGLRLRATREHGPELIRLLEETPFGSAGLRYRRLAVERQLQRLPDPLYLELLRERTLIGSYVLSAREIDAGGVEALGLYRGLLSIRPEAQGLGLGRVLVERTLAWLADRARACRRRIISYGCIERSNTRSLTLLRSLGAEHVGTLHTLNVYRQWPRRRLTAETLGGSDIGLIRSAVGGMLADCGLRTTDPAPGRFHAVTDDAGILAGAAASVTRIDFERIGGVWDLLSGSLFRLVPAARRRFDPHDFAYLRLNDVIARPGHEGLWPDFLSTLLAEYGVHMALFTLDPRSDIAARLTAAGLFGRVTEALRQEVSVLATAWNMEAGSLAGFAGRPIGLGPIDL